MSVSYAETLRDKLLLCSTVYDEAELNGIFIEGPLESIRSSMRHPLGFEQVVVNNRARIDMLTRVALSQTEISRAAHCKDEKPYYRYEPSARSKRNECVSLTFELSSLDSDMLVKNSTK